VTRLGGATFLGRRRAVSGFFEVAGEARGVEAEDGQRGGLVAERFDDDERGMGLGMFGADAVLVLIEAEGDQIVLERSNTVERHEVSARDWTS